MISFRSSDDLGDLFALQVGPDQKDCVAAQFYEANELQETGRMAKEEIEMSMVV